MIEAEIAIRLPQPPPYREQCASIADSTSIYILSSRFRWWTDPDVLENADRLADPRSLFLIAFVDAEEPPLTWVSCPRCGHLPHPRRRVTP